jgi:hypothetical protein
MENGAEIRIRVFPKHAVVQPLLTSVSLHWATHMTEGNSQNAARFFEGKRPPVRA